MAHTVTNIGIYSLLGMIPSPSSRNIRHCSSDVKMVGEWIDPSKLISTCVYRTIASYINSANPTQEVSEKLSNHYSILIKLMECIWNRHRIVGRNDGIRNSDPDRTELVYYLSADGKCQTKP